MSTISAEILHQICINLRASAAPEDFAAQVPILKTLISISATSKWCHAVVRPYIYRTIAVGVGEDNSTLLRLLRTLIQLPGTGDLVRAMRVVDWGRRPDVERTAEHLAMCNTGLDMIKPTPRLRKKFEIQLRHNADDVEFALLLCLCPNLTYLSIKTSSHLKRSLVIASMAEPWGPQLLSEDCIHEDREEAFARTLPHPFIQIATLDLEINEPTYGATDLADMRPLLRLPALHTLKTRPLPYYCNLSPAGVGSNIRRIELVGTASSVRDFEDLLKICPHLETLFAQNGAELNTHFWHHICTFMSMQGPRIKSFSLAHNVEVVRSPENIPIHWGRMNALQLLAVSLNALIDRGNMFPGMEYALVRSGISNKLPLSLRRLRITQAQLDERGIQLFDAALLHLVGLVRFTDLRSIHVQRETAFSLPLAGTGWDDTGSSASWMVLKKAHAQEHLEDDFLKLESEWTRWNEQAELSYHCGA